MNKIKNKFLKFHYKSWEEKITFILYFIFFVFAAICFIFPIWSTILTSFTQNDNIIREDVNSIWDYFVINGKPQFETWKNVIEYFSIPTNTAKGSANLLDMLFNSIWFTFFKVFLSLASSTVLAYAVAKYNFPGKRLIYVMAVFVQTIPLFGSGSTSYRLFDALHMVNNPMLFWIAWCTGFDFTFIIMHGTFTGISNSYSEAAKIDGASDLTILLRIIIPMALPTLLALFISNSLTVWNDYSTIMVYLRDYPTLGYGLYQFSNRGGMYVPNSTAVKNAATLISMAPIIIIYSISQKLILTNISVGGLKG